MYKCNAYGTFNLVGGIDIRTTDPYFIYDVIKDEVKFVKSFSKNVSCLSIEAFNRGAYRFLLKDGNYYKEVTFQDMSIYLFSKDDSYLETYLDVMDRRLDQLKEFIVRQREKHAKKNKLYNFDAGRYGIHKLCDSPCKVTSIILKSAYISERRWHY